MPGRGGSRARTARVVWEAEEGPEMPLGRQADGAGETGVFCIHREVLSGPRSGTSCPVCLCFSTSRSKELSPGSGQKGSPGSSQGAPCAGTPAGTSPGQPPADQSPHTLRKGTSRHLHLHLATGGRLPAAWKLTSPTSLGAQTPCGLANRSSPVR